MGWSLKQMSMAGSSITPERADGPAGSQGLLQLGLPCLLSLQKCLAWLRGGRLFFGRYLKLSRSVAWDKRWAALPLGMVRDGKVSQGSC